MKNTEYNLTDFLLNIVRSRPGMFLEDAKISSLRIFIQGYRFGYMSTKQEVDCYFGENGFVDWFCDKYKVNQPSDTMGPFLIMAKDNEEEALELYFKYLEEFKGEKAKLE